MQAGRSGFAAQQAGRHGPPTLPPAESPATTDARRVEPSPTASAASQR